MIDELFSEGPWLLLLAQSTACLAAGLAASYALRQRPARAHQVLLTAMLASLLMPGLYLSVKHFGFGVLSPRTVPCSTGTPNAKGSRLGTRPALGGVLLPAEGGWATDIRLLPDPPTTEVTVEPTPSEAEPIGVIPTPSAATGDVPWRIIAVVGWAVTTTILLLRLILRFGLGLRLLRAGPPLESEHLRRALDGARSRLGVIQPVGIRCSERVQSPVIWCWGRRPVLLMQKTASDDPEGTDWVGVFCHELAHWRRRDHLSGLFAELLVAVLPWHPLLWWTRGRLLKLSEQACDDWVLATGQSGVDYAEILLGLAAERQMAFLPTVIGKEKTMHVRIRRIIQDNGSDPRLGMRWTLAVGALALCTTVGVAVAQRRPAGPEPMDAPPAKVFQERREIEVREPPEVDQQRIAMKRVLERLMKQAEEKKEMLREGNDLSEQERYIQQIELKLLVEQIEQMKHRFATLDRDGPARREPAKIASRELMEPDREARFDSLRQRHDELVQRAQKMERQLEELRGGQDQEPEELKLRLKEVHAERVDVEKEMEGLKRAQADELKSRKLDELKRAQAEVRREIVVRKPAAEEQEREARLQDLRLHAEKLARALKENPDREAEKGEALRAELEETRAKLRAVEQESRGPKAKKEALAPKREYRVLKEDVKIEKKTPDGPRRIITGPAGNPRLEARVYALEHIDPERMRAIVEALLEKPETVTLYANGRKATVVATAENHQRIERIIRIVDVSDEEYMADVREDGRAGLTAIKLQYFSPKRMQSLLGAVLGQPGRVHLDERTRTVLVETTNANMKRVDSIVRELDTPEEDRAFATEVEELRSQMRGLTEQMRQIQNRLDRMVEQNDAGQTSEPAGRPQESNIEY